MDKHIWCGMVENAEITKFLQMMSYADAMLSSTMIRQGRSFLVGMTDVHINMSNQGTPLFND